MNDLYFCGLQLEINMDQTEQRVGPFHFIDDPLTSCDE